MKITLICLFLISICIPIAKAQIVETVDESREVLDGVNLVGNGKNFVGRTQTAKYTAIIANEPFDLYIYNSFTPISFGIEQQNKLELVGSEILSQLGGLINVSLSKTISLGKGISSETKDIEGGQLNFRLGNKTINGFTIDASGEKGNYIPTLQSSIDLRYLIPLIESGNSKGKDLKKTLVGNLSFRVYGNLTQVLTSEYDPAAPGAFYQLFKDGRGNPAGRTILSGNVEANLFLSNLFYISAGYTFSNQSHIPGMRNQGFVSISYTGQAHR